MALFKHVSTLNVFIAVRTNSSATKRKTDVSIVQTFEKN